MTQPQPSATAIFYRNLRWLRFVDRFGRKGSQALEYVGGLAEPQGLERIPLKHPETLDRRV